MVCGKCKFEFCWLCLTSYKGYIHQEKYNFCPIRVLICRFIFFGLLTFLNMKIVIISQTIREIEAVVFRVLAVLSYVDLWILTLWFFEYLMFKKLQEGRRAYSSWDRTNRRLGSIICRAALIVLQVCMRVYSTQSFIRSDEFLLGMVLLVI